MGLRPKKLPVKADDSNGLEAKEINRLEFNKIDDWS